MSGGGVAGGAVGGSDGGSAGGRSGGSLGGKEGEVMLPLTEATTSARATDESSSCRQAAIGDYGSQFTFTCTTSLNFQ
jgi:hypothetical protein